MSMWYSHATVTPSTDTQIITGRTREKWYLRWFFLISSLDKEHAEEGSLQGVFFSMGKILHCFLTIRKKGLFPEPYQLNMIWDFLTLYHVPWSLTRKHGLGWGRLTDYDLVDMSLRQRKARSRCCINISIELTISAKNTFCSLAHNRYALTTIRLCYLKYLKPCSQTLSVFNQLHMSRSLRPFLGNSTPDWGCQLECISKWKSACQSTP